MALVYRVRMMGSERGWGRERWTEDYDTYQDAKDRIDSVNQANEENWSKTGRVPDYYVQPVTEHIEVFEKQKQEQS